MQITLKLILSIIIINILYKYIKNNTILILLTTLALFQFTILNINFIQMTNIILTTTFITIVIEKLKKKSKLFYQLFNIDQFDVINNGVINYRNLVKIDMTLEDLLDKLKYENIDEIDLCLVDKKREITIFRNKDKIPSTIIIDGKIKYKNLLAIKKTENWLNSILQKKEIELNQVLYAFYINNKIIFIKSIEKL